MSLKVLGKGAFSSFVGGLIMEWTNGRSLTSATVGNQNISFKYNSDGTRKSKTVGSETYEYHYAGGKLISITKSNGYKMTFVFDESGRYVGFDEKLSANGFTTSYIYIYNAQGDVIQLRKSNGYIIANYRYDAWGKLLYIKNRYDALIGPGTDNVANRNPIRYRGYFYDNETGFYYCKSRYYDPIIRRWINADSLMSTATGFIGFNMFAYCGNNPINRKDPTGQFWITALIVLAVVAICTVTLSGCSAKPDPAPLPYKTVDEAAMAFANSTYSSSRYIRHEYGTVIYSCTTDGTTTYDFATPVAGSPHSVGYEDVIVPSGTTKVATAHTHPNSNSFSGLTPGATSGDIPNAIRRGLDSYVIGPNLNLQKYSISSGTVSIVGVASPFTLTSEQQDVLVSHFQLSWDNHLGKCPFGCEHMTWPTP